MVKLLKAKEKEKNLKARIQKELMTWRTSAINDELLI